MLLKQAQEQGAYANLAHLRPKHNNNSILFVQDAVIVMLSQSDWLDRYKLATGIQSDYRLAKNLNLPKHYINQLRQNRIRLRLATVLQMAEAMRIEPLEIMISLEFARCREHERPRLIDWYFAETIKTIGERMSAQSTAAYHPRRRR